MISRFTVSTALATVGCFVLATGPASAQTTNTSPDASGAGDPVTNSSNDIIVTATKRNENLREVALPISAVTGDQLAKANANSLSDYITRLPGVVFNDYQPGVSEVVIRGIAATTYHEQGQTTVGYYLNEIPLVEPGFPIGIPDIDTFDLDRVEVLRGPQGTLFGSSTLGGLVNYIAKTADPSKLDVAASGLIGSTKNASGGLNYAMKGMVNVPIIADKLAVRVMALQRYDAGYLDNAGLGQKGTNDFRTRGLRGSIVFTPSAATKITYLSTYQETDLDDGTFIDLGTKYGRPVARPEPQSTDFWLNSLRLDQDLDFATLTVFGSIDKKNNRTVFSNFTYGYITGVTTGQGAAYSVGNADANIKQVEARLASKGDGRFRWLIGTSYLRAKKFSYDQAYQTGAAAFINANPALYQGYSGSVLAPGDRYYGYRTNSLNEDFGIFGEVTFLPIPTVELTVGGRYYNTNAEATVLNQAGAFDQYSVKPVDASGSVKQKEDGFTPKVTLAYKPSRRFLAYATYSRGFRVGGINPNAGLLAAIPTAYDSDSVDNFEVGTKFSTLDGRLLIDLTAFHIKWKDIQARLFGPAPSYFSYVSNAGGARINGVEFSGSLTIVPHLVASTNITYQDGQLTKFLPDTFALGGGHAAGTTLPGSSHWSIANNISYTLVDVTGAPSLELAHRYLSKAPVAFDSTVDRGGFNLFDARVGYDLTDNVRLLGFINNIFDKRGLLNAPFPPYGSITRPRTYGLRVDFGL